MSCLQIAQSIIIARYAKYLGTCGLFSDYTIEPEKLIEMSNRLLSLPEMYTGESITEALFKYVWADIIGYKYIKWQPGRNNLMCCVYNDSDSYSYFSIYRNDYCFTFNNNHIYLHEIMTNDIYFQDDFDTYGTKILQAFNVFKKILPSDIIRIIFSACVFN